MAFTKCNNCKSRVPVAGQCNSCGFVHGLDRSPTDEEFLAARKVNDKHEYEHFWNIDMKILHIEQEIF